MTKRRDRNRAARRRKRVYRFYWSNAEEHAKLKERLTAAYPQPRTRNHWKGTR